jgi:hypothetical protein
MTEKVTAPCSMFASLSSLDKAMCACGYPRSNHAAAARGGEHDLCVIPGLQQVQTPIAGRIGAADILQKMADTFRERNGVYKDNYKMIAPMVKAMFPEGVPPELVTTEHWHLFELILVKLARFASTNLTHIDSIHDAAIYSAMIEAILSTENAA